MNVAVIPPSESRASETCEDALGADLLRPIGADGIYARTALYEEVVDSLARLISRHRHPAAEVLRFPPVMSRFQLERSGYLSSFPNLLGCVCALGGTEAEIQSAADVHANGGDWTAGLMPADLVLSPAACYPVYPLAAARGIVPPGGWRFDVASECFRREPSRNLDRLQSFRMREYVRIGAPDEVAAFRDEWMGRGEILAAQLGLRCRVAPASDPFFGRVGRVKAVSQLQQTLKFELLIPIFPGAPETACMSFNCHRDHFGLVWDLRDAKGSAAHTACVAFGMDRLAVAMFARHGTSTVDWPESVRAVLDL